MKRDQRDTSKEMVLMLSGSFLMLLSNSLPMKNSKRYAFVVNRMMMVRDLVILPFHLLVVKDPV